MPTFNDYLKLIQDQGATRPEEITRALRRDNSLQEWHRKTLLVQLDMSLKTRSIDGILPDRLPIENGQEGIAPFHVSKVA